MSQNVNRKLQSCFPQHKFYYVNCNTQYGTSTSTFVVLQILHQLKRTFHWCRERNETYSSKSLITMKAILRPTTCQVQLHVFMWSHCHTNRICRLYNSLNPKISVSSITEILVCETICVYVQMFNTCWYMRSATLRHARKVQCIYSGWINKVFILLTCN
jgi:hypothetical protein